MLSFRLLRVLGVVSALLSLAYAQSSAPSLLWHDANTAATFRWFPGCAINNHQIGQYSAAPTMVAFGGTTTSYSFLASFDITTSGGFDNNFNAAATPSTINYTPAAGAYTGSGCNPYGRVAPGAAFTSAGTLVIAGGRSCPNWNLQNDVIYSTDNGNTVNQATAAAPWALRSDMEFIAEPNTNNLLLIGGSNINTGAGYNDVWRSTDGFGAVWTLITAAPGFQPFQEGAATFLYDAASNGGVPTVVLYHPLDNVVYTSTNYGLTWTTAYNIANTNLDPNQDARMVAGADNALYLAGGNQNGDDTVLFSPSSAKGTSWSQLNTSNFNANVSNTVNLVGSTYSCLGLVYQPSSTSPTGYHDQLVLFAGNLTVEDFVWSGFQCLFDEGTQVVTSVVAEILQAGEVYTVATSTPPSNLAPQLIHHDAGQWLSYRLYADCEYDRHQAATKTSGLKMWQMGGFTSGYSYINSVDYTSTGSWLNMQVFNQPSYSGSPSGAIPSGRVAGGVAYLYNGNLLYFGGKDNASAVYTNDIYSSSDNGQTYTYVGQAGFSPRSDFATAVLPMTNIVVVIGGMFSATGGSSGTPVNDVWYSNGGSSWTQQTVTSGGFPAFQDAAFTALYDSSTVNSTYTQQYSTLILYTGGYEDIFYSSDLGATWTTQAAPWSYRLHGIFLADADNWVYFTGGADDGQIWFSWNKGVSWTNLNTANYQNTNNFNNNNGQNNGRFVPSSYYQNLFNYLGVTATTGQCAAVRYTANSASPGGYHKTLVFYGGANVYSVASLPSPSCVLQEAVNVLYTEVMRPSERSNPSWTDTSLAVAPANTVPSVTFNSPTVLMTYRQYPTCAYDVHSLTSHPSAPTTFVLGGWDQNNNVLGTYDIVNGTSFSSYQYVASWGPNNNPPNGRTGAGAAYLANGNLIWFGGKTNSDDTSNNMVNDVWVETNPMNANGRWQRSARRAPWFARSDMSVAAMPGTNCLVMVGGTQVNGNEFNDVWASCDGQGASWTQQTAAAPWWPSQQGAFTALYDGTATGGSQTNATLIYYPSYNQLLYSSTNGGVAWTSLGVVPWSYRTAARFVSDAESNVYMIGGDNFGSVGLDYTNALGTQSLNDVWFSNTKGVSWWQMTTTSNSAYNSPVQPSSLAYHCAFINYQSGSGPNGYHRQLAITGGFQQVYSTNLQFSGFQTYTGTQFRFPICICDEISGVRAMAADLIFPGESVSSASSGSSSGNKFSSGATAGIAVGVAIAAIILTSFVWCLLGGAVGAAAFSRRKGNSGGSGKASRFEDAPEQSTNSEAVEMHTNTEEGNAPSSP